MNPDLYFRYFDSLMSRGPSRGPTNVYVYMKFITDRSKAMLLLWFILVADVRPLFVCL